MSNPQLPETHGYFTDDCDGNLGIVRVQEIDTSFVDFLRELKSTSVDRREDLEPVCSVPAVIADSWMMRGFNIFDPNVTARDIRRRLMDEGLDHFITTTKAI